jgi:acetyl-CoA carboxylase carboxyl transferase subunit alpha
MMLEYSTYSVISPEGCASILWKSVDRAADAAEALGITSARIKELALIDRVISEPLGGAHRDPESTACSVGEALVAALTELEGVSTEDLIAQRYQRLTSFGVFKED